MSKSTQWEYQHLNLEPTESHFDALRENGKRGWEAWHMERSEAGWKVIYFKRRIEPNEGETK